MREKENEAVEMNNEDLCKENEEAQKLAEEELDKATGGFGIPNHAPLIILDGMPFTSGIPDIKPSDIESIDILKDASSTAIYGSRGAN